MLVSLPTRIRKETGPHLARSNSNKARQWKVAEVRRLRRLLREATRRVAQVEDLALLDEILDANRHVSH